MLCPVCLREIGVTNGVVDPHTTERPHRVTGRKVFCPMSGKTPFVWDERSTRQAVPNRSDGRCEFCCAARATNMHHRKKVSQGGLWTPSNILHVCGSGTTGCHGYFEEHPRIAYRLGVSVKRDQKPELVPVQTANGLLWLSDDIAPPLPGWAR